MSIYAPTYDARTGSHYVSHADAIDYAVNHLMVTRSEITNIMSAYHREEGHRVDITHGPNNEVVSVWHEESRGRIYGEW